MLKVLIIFAVLLLLLGARLLPRMGRILGGHARKPYRQARWMWSWFAGSEAEALEAELEYGLECAREFAAQFPSPVPAAKQELVAEVGVALAAATPVAGREFRFRVIAALTANAYALPGGFVFVTEPLLDLCGHDRDEVAFLLGHEMGHILRGHARDQLTASLFLNAVTARLAGAGGMLRQALGKGYSRELELEADLESVRLAAAAGFDPGGAVRALERMARIAPDEPGLAEYFASHPPFAERVRELQRRRKA